MNERRVPVVSAGITLNSWAWASESSNPVLLLHGGRDQSRSWDPYVALLQDEFAFVAADLRGHGDSGWSPEGNYGIADLTADMAEVLLSIPGPVSIVAHSLGGNIALRLAALFPERVNSVAAIECLELPEVRGAAALPIADRFRSWFDERKAYESKIPPLYPDLAAVRSRLSRQYPFLAPALVEHLAEQSVREVAGGYTWKFDHRSRTRPPLDSDGRDFDSMLASVQCPVLLFYGDESFVPLPQPSRLALLRSVELRRYAGAGHWLHHQQLERFAADTANFLKDRSISFA